MEYKITYKGNLYLGEKVTPAPYFDINLTQGELFRYEKPHTRIKVHCQQGVVWITQSGNPTDFLLRAGESFTSINKGVVLTQALQKGSIRVSVLN